MWNQMRQMGRASGKGFIQHIHCQGCCSAVFEFWSNGTFFLHARSCKTKTQMTLFSCWNELANLLQHLVLKGDRCLYLDCSKKPRCRWSLLDFLVLNGQWWNMLLGAERRWVKQGLALCLTVAMEKIASFTGTPWKDKVFRMQQLWIMFVQYLIFNTLGSSWWVTSETGAWLPWMRLRACDLCRWNRS